MAREFIARGNFLWNSGMFCFKATVFFRGIKLVCSEVYETSKIAWENNQAGNLDLISLWLFLLLVLIML
jgi:mannose-1-phosphate guanylyltransferase